MKTKQTKTQKLVQGHGINDLAEPVKINGKTLKFYDVWKAMLNRCYSEKCQDRQPTYRNCSVCDSWLKLSVFKEWFDTNYRDNTELDKDILVKGNKVYSPDTCRFVPQCINNLLTNAAASRGDLPLGVSVQKPSPKNRRINAAYTAHCWDGHGERHTKNLKTVPEAAAWYSMKKKEVVKDIVLESFWRNEIMSDVATALLEREW